MRIGVDLDGCVYDFVGALRTWLCSNHGMESDWLPDAQRWDFFEDWGLTAPQFLQHCTESVDAGHLFRHGWPIHGAKRALDTLRAEGHTLHVVTNRAFGRRSVENTEAWLIEHAIPFDSLTFAADKTTVRTDAFIEDNVENHLALRAAGVKSFLLQRPWNAHHQAHTVLSWPHFVMVIHALTGQPEPEVPETALEEAQRLVHGNRGEDYGHPADDFTRTGRMWGAILDRDDVPPELVGLCMAAVKISREVNKPKRDNRVDLAGYAETVEMIHQRRESLG